MKTILDIQIRAENAINRQEQIIFEVSANNGQSFRNVAHMKWFKLEVMKALCYTYKRWSHLLDKVESMNVFDL